MKQIPILFHFSRDHETKISILVLFAQDHETNICFNSPLAGSLVLFAQDPETNICFNSPLTGSLVHLSQDHETNLFLFTSKVIMTQISVLVHLSRDRESKMSRGFGFITFECTEDCEDAVRGMNQQVTSFRFTIFLSIKV